MISKVAEIIMSNHHWQDFRDAQVAAKSLAARSLVQVRGDGYLVHDVLLDFAKDRINLETNRETKKAATSRQARYLSRLNVIKAYRSSAQEGIGGYYSLAALWRCLEDLSGDKALEVKMYRSSLDALKQSKASVEIASIFDIVASLFYMQVGRCIAEVISINYRLARMPNNHPMRLSHFVFDAYETWH